MARGLVVAGAAVAVLLPAGVAVATTPPATPTRVSAVGADQQVLLYWGNTAGAASYEVYRDGQPVARTPDVFPFVDAGLANGTPHTYTVSALTSDGTEGARSAPVAVTPAAVTPAVGALYASLGGPGGAMGAATGPGRAVPGGAEEDFANGVVVQQGTGTPQFVVGQVATKFASAGGVAGPLGWPVISTVCGLAQGGCGQHFQNGSIYWSDRTGAHSVAAGPVRDKWAAWGWVDGALGYPTIDTLCGITGGGCGQHFDGGSIYADPGTGTHVVLADVRTKWASVGWQDGFLGYPTTDTICGLAQGGCGQHFQRGSIYLAPAAGGQPWIVTGAIRDHWAALNWVDGPLGYPVADAQCGLVGGGCIQYFTGGELLSSPGSGTFDVLSWFQWSYGDRGGQNGVLGYPVTDTICGLAQGGCGQHFQGGSLYRAPGQPAAIAVRGAIRDLWARLGWVDGRLGYPTFQEVTLNGWVSQTFQHGQIDWSPRTGALVHWY